MSSPLFPLGQIGVSAAVDHHVRGFLKEKKYEGEEAESRVAMMYAIALRNHETGCWGLVCDEDKAANDLAVAQGLRILSKYRLCERDIYVITEHDRSHTTILFPEDY